MLNSEQIAPCGMNCGICYGYQRKKNKCDGCRADRNLPDYCKRCVIKNCPTIKENISGFCYECAKYPCNRLKALDKRYKTNYKMSMIDNLLTIKQQGIKDFLDKETQRWKCPTCGGVLCVHRDDCIQCHPEAITKRVGHDT